MIIVFFCVVTMITVFICASKAFIQGGDSPLVARCTALLLAVIAGMVTWIPLQAMTTCLDHRSAIVKNGQVFHQFGPPQTYWRWVIAKWLREEGASLVTVSTCSVRVAMHLQPITQNPKVRNLKYIIRLTVNQHPQMMLALEKVLGEWKSRGVMSVSSLAEYLCYELHEEESVSMAKFYNPRDSGQQSSFSILVRSFFARKLDWNGPHRVEPQFVIEEVAFTLA